MGEFEDKSPRPCPGCDRPILLYGSTAAPGLQPSSTVDASADAVFARQRERFQSRNAT